MREGKTIAVVVPAYNEERLIGRVIETMPAFVDNIVVIDDCSADKTAEIVRRYQSTMGTRLVLLQHDVNQGVGGAIATGYKWCRDHDLDVAVVMAGDAQMDPEDLPALLEPVIRDEVDYTKGNRLISGEAWTKIPKIRYLGNAALSMLTKIASGFWHVADSQTGYTAINRRALHTIDWDQMYKRFGQPNDLLVRLNVFNFRVRDVEIRPIYQVGEISGIKPIRIIPRLSLLLFKLFLWRMKEKYIVRDFHPLVLFYGMAFVLLTLSVPLFIRLVWVWARVGVIPSINILTILFTWVLGAQSLFFAMWFDMEYNKHLR
jgi:glycosyltransferase involved in cell wall biosynthesis